MSATSILWESLEIEENGIFLCLVVKQLVYTRQGSRNVQVLLDVNLGKIDIRD